MNSQPSHPLLRIFIVTALCSAVLGFWGLIVQDKPADTALFPVNVGGLYGYLTPKGTWAVTPRFEAANPFADDGGAWVRFQGKYGRINDKGEWLARPDFDDLKALAADGLAQAKSNGKWGFINTRGEWSIQPILGELYI